MNKNNITCFKLRYLLLFFISFVASSQIKIFTGVVSDSLGLALESANIIAKPITEKGGIKFSITDAKGRYKLDLDSKFTYQVSVSYLGYKDETIIVEYGTTILSHNFTLAATGHDMGELVINHEVKPIEVKKDTLIFDVKSFASGNERKMKEVLEKLPGVEVDKNGTVTVQGKEVTKMMVEGKSFFGGGSKLAVENIPADALDKIEVIDNFNEVGFMKQVSGSRELAMNVKLKENKKKFIFGDVQASRGNDSYYLAHAALFYYSPKTNMGFIGDVNNIGQHTFNFDDMMRFGGRGSDYINKRKSMSNLYTFTVDNKDVVKNESKFAAFNIDAQLTDKLDLNGYSLFSKLFTKDYSESVVDYLQNNAGITEQRFYTGNNKSVMAIGNVKLDYDTGKAEKWYYNIQYQFSDNDFNSTLNSVINQNQTVFETLKKADNLSVNQYVEWHKSYNDFHTSTMVLSHSYEKSTPVSNWITNEQFLPGLVPLQEDAVYNVNQVKEAKSNNLDALVKHYWILNNNNHIYTSLGNNYNQTDFTTNEWQQLTNNTVNNFSSNGLFGNTVKYMMNDAFVIAEYKFTIGKLINRPGVSYHWYSLKSTQPTQEYSLTKLLFEPQYGIDYEFSKSESLRFNYKLSNIFASVEQLSERYMLQSYNSVYKGNALLRNERYHTAMLYYNKMSMYNGLMMNANVSFNKKVRTIRNQVEVVETTQDGIILINQLTTPVLTDNPETNWNAYGWVQKKIGNFSIKVNSRLSWFEYVQTLNGETRANSQTSQNIGVALRTANKKWPFVSIGYNKFWSQFAGLTSSSFENDVFAGNLEYEVMKGWVITADYSYVNNTSPQQKDKFYHAGNAALLYKGEKSPWSFEVRVNNFLNNRKKISSSFSDYTISTQTIYVLPRIALFTITYKL